VGTSICVFFTRILTGARQGVGAAEKDPTMRFTRFPRVEQPTQPSARRVAAAKKVFEKSHAGAIRFSIRRIEARSIIVSEVCTRYS